MRSIPSPGLMLGAMLALFHPLGAQAAPEVRFTRDVQPILQTYCLRCHLPGGEGHLASGLRLDSYESLMAGSRSGPVVVPYRSADSLMYRLMAGEVNYPLRMPHFSELIPEATLKTVKRWISQGARSN